MIRMAICCMVLVGFSYGCSKKRPEETPAAPPASENRQKESSVEEQKAAVTLKGSPFTLLGRPLQVGDKAPEFTLTGVDLSEVKLSDYRGKVLVITTVPSLDTPVCDIETHKFNERAAGLGEEVRILTVSMDLPFAQARWCGAAGVKNLKTASDYKTAAMGAAYGVLIKELHLLARAVFVVDRQGVIRYKELVKEIASEPNYDAAVNAAQSLVGK